MRAAPQQPHSHPVMGGRQEQLWTMLPGCCRNGREPQPLPWPGRSLLSSGLESQTLAMDVPPSSNCCTTHGLAALLTQLFPEQAAEVLEALDTALDTGPGCYSNLAPLIFSQGLWRVQPTASEAAVLGHFKGSLQVSWPAATCLLSQPGTWAPQLDDFFHLGNCAHC